LSLIEEFNSVVYECTNEQVQSSSSESIANFSSSSSSTENFSASTQSDSIQSESSSEQFSSGISDSSRSFGGGSESTSSVNLSESSTSDGLSISTQSESSSSSSSSSKSSSSSSSNSSSSSSSSLSSSKSSSSSSSSKSSSSNSSSSSRSSSSSSVTPVTNNFSSDPNCMAVYNLEDGALTVDSKGTNTLSEVLTPTANTSDFKQGQASVDFDSGDTLLIYDSNLNSGFPLKSGESNTDFSVCGWMKIRSGNNYLAGKYGSGGYTLIVVANSSLIDVYLGHTDLTTTQRMRWLRTFTANQWYHIGVTYNDTTRFCRVRVWDDVGASVSESTLTFDNNILLGTASLQLGGIFNGGLSDGLFDEVVFFNRDISITEIDAIRDGTFGAPSSSSSSSKSSSSSSSDNVSESSSSIVVVNSSSSSSSFPDQQCFNPLEITIRYDSAGSDTITSTDVTYDGDSKFTYTFDFTLSPTETVNSFLINLNRIGTGENGTMPVVMDPNGPSGPTNFTGVYDALFSTFFPGFALYTIANIDLIEEFNTIQFVCTDEMVKSSSSSS